MKKLSRGARRVTLTSGAATLAAALVALVGCVAEHKSRKYENDRMGVAAITTAEEPETARARADRSIVITGSKEDRVALPTDRPNKARIDDLNGQALDSQGGENGQPPMSPAAPRTIVAPRKSALEKNRVEIEEREAARTKLFDDARHPVYPNRPGSPDRASVAAIDKQLVDLKAQRATLEADLATRVAIDDRKNLATPRRTAAHVRVDLEANRLEIENREAARKNLLEDARATTRRNRPTLPDPDSMAALDKQLGDLTAQKVKLEAELATLVAIDDRKNLPASLRTAAHVRVDLELNRSEIADREAARKKIYEDARFAAYPDRPATLLEPDRVAALDRQLGDLKAQKVTLEAELAALVAHEYRDNGTR